jgi:hypothetical protein
VLVAFAGLTIASTQEKQKPSSEADIRAALFGGVPMGRWKEGLLFEGIKPQPWLKSAANWLPRTEDVQPDEMRIIFMGSAPFPSSNGTAVESNLRGGRTSRTQIVAIDAPGTIDASLFEKTFAYCISAAAAH